MAPARISFAIPYYRGISYLAEAIESVRAQTIDDWDLLVVDDRGPEPADDLIASYDDPRIRYLRNETNLGLAGNWNECVRQAKAPLVTLLHGDDRLLPLYAERVLAAAAGHPTVAVVFTDALIIDAVGRPTTTLADEVKKRMPRPSDDHLLSGDRDLAGLLRGNYIVCPSMCLRRSLVGDTPFDSSLRFVPDWSFTSRILLEGGKLWGVRTPLIEYRRHDSSQTSILTEETSRFVEEIDFLRTMADATSSAGMLRSARTARRRVTVRVHLLVLALMDSLRRKPGAAAKWRLLRDDLRRP